MLLVLPKISANPVKKQSQTNSITKPSLKIQSLNADICYFSPAFKGASWGPIKELITRKKIINGQKVFVNVQEFIDKGKDSLLCQKIPILRDTFDYRVPMKDYKINKYTVGDHTIEVVNHLIHHNEEFKKLSLNNQELIISVALFHDVGKIENPIKRSLLAPKDFESNSFNDTAFDKHLKAKMAELEIFNPFENYKKIVIDYFNNNKNLDEAIIHNNNHPTKSAEMVNDFLQKTPENSAELEKMSFLIKYHQDMGRVIDKYQYGYVSKKEMLQDPTRLSHYITNTEDLNLIKTFHISDTYGVPQPEEKRQQFIKYLKKTCSKVEKLILRKQKPLFN